jgi:hypothetical protein
MIPGIIVCSAIHLRPSYSAAQRVDFAHFNAVAGRFAKPQLQGIYAGQPGRKTDRPSAELLLGALKTISISVVEVNGRIHALLSPLTEVQKRLLELWDLPPDLYENVALRFPEPP